MSSNQLKSIIIFCIILTISLHCMKFMHSFQCFMQLYYHCLNDIKLENLTHTQINFNAVSMFITFNLILHVVKICMWV